MTRKASDALYGRDVSDMRAIVTNNVRAEERIERWMTSQAQADPRPVSWNWAAWAKSGYRDALEDIEVTFSNGKKRIMTPIDLPQPATVERHDFVPANPDDERYDLECETCGRPDRGTPAHEVEG